MSVEKAMERPSEYVPKGSHKVCFIATLSICVILAVTVGVYYVLSSDNADLWNYEDDDLFDYTPETVHWVNNVDIQNFRKYLRYRTISLQGGFDQCVKFLKRQAEDLDLDVSVYYPANNENPVVVMTWYGSHPEFPSIMLNSHMDVVSAAVEQWNHHPFAADIDAKGNIYGRGAQDMKSIGMQYLGVIRALKRNGQQQLERTIHVTYMPDEETGGHFGMEAFVKTPEFKNLNVGFVLDKGFPSENENLEVYSAEKSIWKVNVTAKGPTGHGSILFNDTAVGKMHYVIGKFLEFRTNELTKLEDSNYPYGNVTVINLTKWKGGAEGNVVPAIMSASFDIFMAIDADWEEFEEMIKQWAEEAGDNVDLTISKDLKTAPTPIDNSNSYWVAFKRATDELHLNVTTGVFRSAITDSRYIRNMNIPALGFSPLFNTPPMLHEHNEYVNADVYLKGIEIYQKIIETIANM